MAEWRPLHQQLSLRSGLEAGGQAFDPPLLPYEKSLIEAIGCTEEEYKTLVRHAMLRQRVRPAEYDHIPDVVGVGGGYIESVLISLVVGTLFTVASVLLAPKPPTLEDSKIKGKKLADQIGPSRFNQATSFDNAPSLAELNQPIPIPFGKRDSGSDGRPTGGLILVPGLVWSRLYSYGNYQAYEGVYVVGESGVSAPDLGGILLGTAPINSLGSRDFAFYWSSNEGNNRPSALLYGTEGAVDSGTVGREVFTAPSLGSVFSSNFSMAYTPSGDTTFGVSTPIHNGTVFKYNWEVISAPFSSTKGSENRTARNEIIAQRRKIAGINADTLHDVNGEQGQPGEGRAYSRRMGFIYLEKKSLNQDGVNYKYKRTEPVELGDIAVFEIYLNDQTWTDHVAEQEKGFGGSEVNLADLKNAADGWRQRASDLLTIGSRWVCGAVSWMVVARADRQDETHVTMECVAILGDKRLGIAGYATVREALGGYEGPGTSGTGIAKFVTEDFYTLCSLNVASIRPIRRETNTIEIGIRSQVWNRASGLCNFNAVPSPSKLFDLDNKDITLNTPRMDKYFKRSSCFAVWVRPVADDGKPKEEFQRIDAIFCVQGSAPITQNNFLRIRPIQQGYYEYRFAPRSGSDITANCGPSDQVIILKASKKVPYVRGKAEIYIEGSALGSATQTSHGAFGITTQGEFAKVEDIIKSPELESDPAVVVKEPTTVPRRAATGVALTLTKTNTGNKTLHKHAWYTHFLGYAKDYQGRDVSQDIFKYKQNGNREIIIRIHAKSTKTVDPEADNYLAANGRDNPTPNAAEDARWEWTQISFGVVSSTGNWSDGSRPGEVADQFEIEAVPQGADNTFILYADELDIKNGTNVHNYQSIQFQFTITSTLDVNEPVPFTVVSGGGGENRKFEKNTQIADCSFFSEIQKSNESGPEHEISYVNEFIENADLARYDNMSTVGFTVKSSGEINSIEQLRLAVGTGIPVERLAEDPIEKGPSNLFADLVYYLLTNKTQGVGASVPSELVDKDALIATAKYLKINQIFYDGVLEDAESFRSFLYDTAPLQLCSFTIKNGKFGLQPALPTLSTGEINDEFPIAIDGIFTAGNIIEDSLQLQYIESAQRSNIRAVVTWRVTQENDLPYQASALLYWSDLDEKNTTEQSFDLSEFCTNRDQALRTARFLMSTRRRITKTVSFKTAPDALLVEPGSYIRVMTEASVYDASSNGFIEEAGNINAFISIKDGRYDALLYGSASGEVVEAEIEISNNTVLDSRFHGYLFSLLTRKTDYSVYQIDSLNLEEDGLVSISAVEVPTDENGHSIVAKDVLDESGSIFTVIE